MPLSNGASRRRSSHHGRTGPRGVVLALAVPAVGLALTGGVPWQSSALDPQGPAARAIADLWWLLFWLGTAVFVVVMAVLAYAVLRRRAPDGVAGRANGNGFVLSGGLVMPAAILLVVFGFTLWTIARLAPSAAGAEVTVEVIGHQYWWEVRYPDHDVVTANEIHIPAGEPVDIRLVAGDVIHSFWVPELHGKMDLIPGQENVLRIEADAPGEYQGQCAEFCGVQHAFMVFLVIAQPPDEFAAWLTHQAQPAAQPADPLIQRGQQVYLSGACVYCHAIAGTSSNSPFGPGLTHIASRRTLAAGTVENNPGNLAGWIVDPQNIKPGNQMPGVNLSSEDLQALLAYLNSLE